MPGLYQRDNLAPQLAQAIENAQRRRESIRAIKAQRDRENVNAALNFAKALGRTYETWGDDESKLAALQKEREEAIKAQQEEDAMLRVAKADARPDIGQMLAENNSYNNAMLNRDMAGYVPMSARVVPNYNEMMKRRGLL